MCVYIDPYYLYMQGDYIFYPEVITFDSIALGAINTSFYKREGASDFDNNLIVDQLLGEVLLLSVIQMTCLSYVTLFHTCSHLNLGYFICCLWTVHLAIPWPRPHRRLAM